MGWDDGMEWDNVTGPNEMEWEENAKGLGRDGKG